jgi:GNAT superfamily N-acetyltransferase
MRSVSDSSIKFRPIAQRDLDSIVLRCWPDRRAIDRLFASQETIGMAAWEEGACVGLLHCYRVSSASAANPDWPEWTRWLPDRWPLKALRQVRPDLDGPLWCHACHHVGRTQRAAATSDDPDPRYFRRGIGSGLLRASVQWAKDHGYAAVLASATPAGMYEVAGWQGQMPWPTLDKLGFEPAAVEEEGKILPPWAKDSPPEVQAEFRQAVAQGRAVSDFCNRLMVLDL